MKQCCFLITALILLSFMFYSYWIYFMTKYTFDCKDPPIILNYGEYSFPQQKPEEVRLFTFRAWPDSGLMFQIECVIKAACIAKWLDRKLVLPYIFDNVTDTSKRLPFRDVFDVSSWLINSTINDLITDNIELSGFDIASMDWFPREHNFTLYPGSILEYPDLMKSYIGRRRADVVYSAEKEWLPPGDWRPFMKIFWSSLRVNPKIGQLGEMIRKQLGESYICMHVRVENDGKNHWANPPGYYTWQQHYEKLKKSKHNSTYAIADIDTLYLATGNVTDLSKYLKIFQKLYPRIYHKWNFDISILKERYALLSALDYYICNYSKVFIGNNHSKWSGFLALQRAFYRDEKQETFTNWEGIQKTELQVNGLSQDPFSENITVMPLLPFCGRELQEYFGQRCPYIRTPGR